MSSGAPGTRREDEACLITHALTAEGADASEDGTGRGTPLVVTNDSSRVHGAVVPSLKIGSGVGAERHSVTSVAVPGAAVRRLTPMECERLQGFPDCWTDGQADSPRYRQMGNAVAVPVVEWILHRIVAADRSLATTDNGGTK